MADSIIMPKQGLQMTEGTITRWLVTEGDIIEAGKPLFEMETDKLTITIDSTVSGTLLRILHGEGETVPVANPIAIIGKPGELCEPQVLRDIAREPAAAAAAPQPPARPSSVKRPCSAMQSRRTFITQRAKTIAEQRGINIKNLSGSGPDGLIIERDITLLSDKTGAAMLCSHTVRVDMTGAADMLMAYRKNGMPIDFDDIIFLALARALVRFPAIRMRRATVDIGYAAGVGGATVILTLRGVSRMTLEQIHEAVSEKISAAHKERQSGGDGGVISLYNTGRLGMDESDVPVTPPQAAALSVGRVVDCVIAMDGQVVVRPIATIKLVYDRYAIDIAAAAIFLDYVRALIENPVQMIS